MNVKDKVFNYFKGNWQAHIFIKSVCMVVSASIILNIINLPAYASTEEDLRKKAFSLENRQQEVLYEKGTSFKSVAEMNSLEANIKIDKKTENIFIGKEVKGFLSKEKDKQGRRKVMVRRGEGFVEDEVLTAMVEKKLKGRKSSGVVETRVSGKEEEGRIDKREVREEKSQGQISPEQRSPEQRSPEQRSPEQRSLEQRSQGQRSPEDRLQEGERKGEGKGEEELVSRQEGEAKIGIEGSSNREEEEKGKEEESMYTTKFGQEVARSLEIEEKEYEEMIEEIAKGTGISKEAVESEIIKLYESMDKKEVGEAIKGLIRLFREGKEIVYGEIEELGRELGIRDKEYVTFRAIIGDIGGGEFVKNNEGLIKGETEELVLSSQAIAEVLTNRNYGNKEYVGMYTNIDDIVNGLKEGERVIVEVGGNHFITIMKNEDGTYTKIDINKGEERLTEGELKVAMEREYGIKGEETRTVLVKGDNEEYKGVKWGEERKWKNSDFEGKTQEQYYRGYVEESYEKLMRELYGSTKLTPEQSREFGAFYEEYLKAAIIDLDKVESEEKASEETKEEAKALKSQAAKELAIVEAMLEELREHADGVISGQIGQILLTGQRAYPKSSQGIEEGEYYEVITIYADDLKEQHSIVGSDGKAVVIESYRISKGWSISTREGVTVKRSDGSTYQVFGIGGKFEGMEVAFEYMVAYKGDGTFYMDEKANIYLLNDTDRVYQGRQESGSRPPTSGQYKGGAPERGNWTHGTIIETEAGYIISGAGSRITVKKSSRGWEADAIGIGTEAMRGSVLRIAANDPNGVAATIYLDIKEGYMVYAGNYWVPSDGFEWKFNESVTGEQIEQFLKNTITTQLGANAQGIEEIEVIYEEEEEEAKEKARAKAKEKAEAEIEAEGEAYAPEIPAESYKASHKKEIEAKTEEYFEQIYKEEEVKEKGREEMRKKTMLGAPFSTEAIFKSLGIRARMHTKAGFSYDATKEGDIYKLTIESATVLEIKEKEEELEILATEDIIVHATISEGGWELDTGGTRLSDSIKKGEVVSFGTLLNKTGRQIVNTREIEIITGYEVSGQDEKGNNYYDYSKAKYAKMKAGSFKVGGNSDGKYVLVDKIYIRISDGNWDVMGDQTGSEYNNSGENRGYWHVGSEITIAKKGNTFDISISKGDVTVKNLTVTLYHKMNDSGGGGGDDSGDKYEGPRIEGAYIVERKDFGNMHSYKIETGTFKGVSWDQVTENMLGNFMFVPGSDFKEGSIMQADGTRAKYDSKIKDDGSIDAYGAKWYEKLRDGIVGFFSIVAFALMTIFTVGATVWAKDMKGMEWAKEWAAITYGYWNHVEANGSNEEAVQRGMDLGLAGLAAVAILVVAAISIVGALFSGGASIAAGIGAVVAIAGAIASAVSAINLTNSAIGAFRAGKNGQGALMVFFALLTVVLACVGVGQMGSTIASGLVSLGKQFFIKMAVGAVIGAVAGAGVAAASYGIRHAIDKTKGRAEEVDWGEFGKEVGIGALTGAFAGAAAGAQVASAMAKSVARDVAGQVARGVSKEVAQEAGAEAAKDVSKEITRQVSKQVGEEVGGKIAKEISENVSTQIVQSLTKGVTGAVTKEVAGEVVGSVTKEVAEEVGKNVVDDLAASVAKRVEEQVVEKLLSEGISKEVAGEIGKSVAEKVGKSISSSISQVVAKNVSVTVGQIAKELILGGTSFKRQVGQTALQYVGTVSKSVVTIVGRVGMQALNGYMTYMSAKSFVDSIESGDFMGAVKAMYTLISIDIIMPVMSAHSVIKEGGTLKVGEVAKEGSLEMSRSAKEAEKVASEGMKRTIQGMTVGWKVGSVAITTVVGAGVGVGIAAAIDAVSGKEIRGKDLIIGGAVGGAIGMGIGALASKADWTSLGNSVKTSIAKTLAPFGGKTAELVRSADGTIVIKEMSEFSGATMVRAWGGLVGGGAIGVGIGAGIWAARGRKKEEMARYLIIGGVAGGMLGAGFANAWSSGAYKEYKGMWNNFKANPGSVFTYIKGYIQESVVRSVMMIQDINMFNTYMAYSTGILNQVYSKITGDSLANTEIVKFINKASGMSLFKSQGDLEEEIEYEKRKKKAQEKGEEFKEEGVVYKGGFGEEEVKAVIEQNWGSLTGPTTYAGNFVGGVLKPVVGTALQHSPILGSVMNVMESAGTSSVMQKNKMISMFYNMGVKMRVLNIISKELFDDPNNPDDDQIAGIMGFAFMQMFEEMPVQEQAEAMKFLESSKEISYKDKDGKPVKVELGVELYNSATLLKNSTTKENFEVNLKRVCRNLGFPDEVVPEVSKYIKSGMDFNQIVGSLIREYVIKEISLAGGSQSQLSQSQLLSIRESLRKIEETSPIMKQGTGLITFDIINSISSKLNYVEASAKILELNIEGIEVESIARGSLSKEDYIKILQAQDGKEIGSGVSLLMNYLSGISSVRSIAINELIGGVVEYNNSIELRQAIKANLESLASLKLSEDQINKIVEIVLKEGTFGADNKLTGEAGQAIREALGKNGTNVVVKLIVGNIESSNINMRSLRAEAKAIGGDIESLKAKLAQAQEPVNKAKEEVSKAEVEQIVAQKEILSLRSEIETLRSDIERYKREIENSKGKTEEAQKSLDDANKKYTSMSEQLKSFEDNLQKVKAQLLSKQINLNEAENKFKSIDGIEAIKVEVNAFENIYSPSAKVVTNYMISTLGTSDIAREDPSTGELMRRLERQSYRAESYLAYSSLRGSAAIKGVIEIERLRKIRGGENIRSVVKSIGLSEVEISRIIEIVEGEGAFGARNELTGQSQTGIKEVIGSKGKGVDSVIVREIGEAALSPEQKGQLAQLEAKYLPEEIAFNIAINNMLKEVGRGNLSYEEFGAIVGASEGEYGRVMRAEMRGEVGERRGKLSGLVVDMTKGVIETTRRLEKEGQISKAQAREIIDSIRSNMMEFSRGERRGNVASLMYASEGARSMISSVRSRDIVPVVTADGRFLTFNTGAGKDVVEVNSVGSTQKGMKVNISVNGKNIGDVIFRNNLEAITNNKVVAQAIVEKFPNMLATEIGQNTILSNAVKTKLESLRELNLSEEQIKAVANEIVIKRGALGADNKVSADARQAIREALGKTVTKDAVNLIIGSIETVAKTQADIKTKLQDILCAPESLVFGQNKGYVLSTLAKSEIVKILGQEGAKGVIESIESTLNTEKIVNDVKMFRSDPSQLIKLCSANVNPTAISLLFNYVKERVSIPNSTTGQVIEMSLTDLAGLIENTKDAVVKQLKELLKHIGRAESEIFADAKDPNATFSGDEVIKKIGRYLKDSTDVQKSVRQAVDKVVDKVDEANKKIAELDGQLDKQLQSPIPDPEKEVLKKANEEEKRVIIEELNRSLDPVVEEMAKELEPSIDIKKSVKAVIEDLEDLKGKGIPEEEIEKDVRVRYVFDNTNYNEAGGLSSRLKLLEEKVEGNKTRLDMIDEKFYGKKGLVSQAKEFIKENGIENSEGKIEGLKEGSLDRLREKAMKMAETNGEDAINYIRVTINECIRGAKGFGLRASQLELATTLQNDVNAALGMGGGKTLVLVMDAAVQRVLMGKALNHEILVGNGDLSNFAGASSDGAKVFKFLGMKPAVISDFKAEGGQTNVGKLKEAYEDPDTIIIMDPTMRGHMLNEAASRGGLGGTELRNILQSVNRVTVDEVHRWALTRTAAVIGGDNRPPDRDIIKKAVQIGELINSEEIYRKMIKEPQEVGKIQKITIEGKEVQVVRYNREADLTEANLQGEYIGIIGQQTGSIEIRMSEGIRDILLKEIGRAPKGYSESDMLNSMIKGMFAVSDNGGMKISTEDGKVKPVGVEGIEENMVLNDIYLQLGFALKNGLQEGVVDIETYLTNSTQMSNTSMQTSLAAIYRGASARMVGISGTIEGLQQLIINKTGSGKIYNITGERADPSMFNGVMKIGGELSKEVIIENLRPLLSALKLNEGEINGIVGIVRGEGSLDANNKLTQATWDEIQSKIQKGIEKDRINKDAIKIINGSIGDGLVAKITNVLLKGMQGVNLTDLEAIDNALMLGKTQGSIENFRRALKGAIENVGGLAKLNEMGIEVFEFTDKQGRWTDAEGNVSTDLGNGMKSMTEVAKNKRIKRIIIANEMGATGIDYQGNYINIIADAQLMSNTDLAQALKRTGRPNSSFGNEGGLQRWTTERVIMYEQGKVQGELDGFKGDATFVEYARDLWKGEKAGGNMKDVKSVDWLKAMEEGNFDLSSPKVIEGLYRISGEGKKVGKEERVDIKDPKVIEIAMKEAITFISKVQDLRGVDGSIRFAINDSIRDRMVVSVLTNVVGALAEGKAKKAAEAELKEALKSNSSRTKEIFEVKGKKKAESGEEVMRKAFERSMEEAEDRFGRLQEILRRFEKEPEVGRQIEMIETHEESIRIANDTYYSSKPIVDKGLGEALDMSEFMQIMRSFEEYIMPVASVVDKAESISIERAIEDRASREVIRYVKKESSLSIVNEKGERVLTEKGALFVRMMKEELRGERFSKESRVADMYVWLASKVGASYTAISATADLNTAEKTKRQIENVRNVVDKLEEINKEMRYEVLRDLLVMKEEEERRKKKYSKEEVIEELNKKNEEYVKEKERKKKEKEQASELNENIAGVKGKIEGIEEKIGKLEEEYEGHVARYKEKGEDEAAYEIVGQIGEARRELEIEKEEEDEHKSKGKEEVQEEDNNREKKIWVGKEGGREEEEEVEAGVKVEGLEISAIERRVKESLEKDGTLSKTDGEGNRVLTQKGVIYAKVGKEIVGGNKGYVKFLKEGPLSEVGGIGEKIRGKLDEKGEIKYDKAEELVKEITEALWEENIWEYEKVEKMYGFYGILPARDREEILGGKSVGEIKGILNARHKQAVKGIAEQRGYRLPEAEVVELARVTKGKKIEGGNERIGKYIGDIVKRNEELEETVKKMREINNGASEASVAGSMMPKVLKKVWAGIRGMWEYITRTKWALKGVSESVDISIEEGIGIVGRDREKVGSLVKYAVGVGSNTEEGLDNLESIVKRVPEGEVGRLLEGHVNWKKVAVTGGLIVGGIGIVVGLGVLMAFIGPVVGLMGIVGAVVMGVGSGLGLVGALAALGNKFNIISKIMPQGRYFEKLKISDIEKFSKIGVFAELVRKGKIDLRKEEEMEKVRGKRLYKAVNATRGYMKEISEEEGRLILGEGGWLTHKRSYDLIKESKRDIVEERVKELVKKEEFRRENKQEEGEKVGKYEQRLKKLARSEVELGYRWSIGIVKGVIESGGYEGDKEEEEKLLAVLLGDGSVNTEELVSRYNSVSKIVDIVDEKVELRDLQRERMFKGDNSISNEFISEYVRPELIMREVERKLEGIGYKEGKGVEVKAGERLVGRMGEGFSRGEELNRAIVQALTIFEDIGSMEEYLGLEGTKGYTKEEIVEGAYRTYKRALELFARGEIGEEGLMQETEIIRVVSEMLMIGKEKAELVEAINKEKIDVMTLNKIEGMVDIGSTKVNRYVFIKELMKEVRGSKGERVFEVKIEDIKKGLERKGEKEEIGLPKGIRDLLPMLERGERGKRYNTVLTMEMRNVRAISQAA